MDIATATDQDIEEYCLYFAHKMRDDLRAKRHEAIVKKDREARHAAMRELEARHKAIEEEMTDARKAEGFSPDARRFPTEAQLDNTRQPRMVSLSIAVSTDKLCGKTSLLLMILDMLADAGALSAADTRYMTTNIADFFRSKRRVNDENVEVLELDLDLNVLYEMSRQTSR